MERKSLALTAAKSFLRGPNRTLLFKTRRTPTHSFVGYAQQVYGFDEISYVLNMLQKKKNSI